jgi:hypothetical protein
MPHRGIRDIIYAAALPSARVQSLSQLAGEEEKLQTASHGQQWGTSANPSRRNPTTIDAP